jgi:hypothetical protein
MTRIKFIVGLCIALLVGAYFLLPNSQKGKLPEPTLSDTVTYLRIINASDSAVTTYITLGTTPGCLQHANQIPFVSDTIGALVGSFILKSHDSTIAYAPAGLGLNGNLSFSSQPINCTTPQFPSGVNIFEFILNNAFQPGNPQQTIDISCVAGVNCFIKCTLSGSNPWNGSSAYPAVTKFYNGDITHNIGHVGVYPFGCDSCTTRSKLAPACDTIHSDHQNSQICNVQRNAKPYAGGIVRVIYLGTTQALK